MHIATRCRLSIILLRFWIVDVIPDKISKKFSYAYNEKEYLKNHLVDDHINPMIHFYVGSIVYN